MAKKSSSSFFLVQAFSWSNYILKSQVAEKTAFLPGKMQNCRVKVLVQLQYEGAKIGRTKYVLVGKEEQKDGGRGELCRDDAHYKYSPYQH